MTGGAKNSVPDQAGFLPTCAEELAGRNWHDVHVLLVTPEPYIDHPSFGAAVLGRFLEAEGWRVGILQQPDWKDPAAFKTLGKPRLWVGISGGTVDSLLAVYTLNRKKRRDDAFGPGGSGGKRPARSSIVYANVIRSVFRDVPIVLGGIEAGTRRFAHVDWWDGKIRRSILCDARADLVVWGEGERVALHITQLLAEGEKKLWGVPGTAVRIRPADLDEAMERAARYFRIEGRPFEGPKWDIAPFPDIPRSVRFLPSYEELLEGPRERLLEASLILDQETRGPVGAVLIQRHGDQLIVSFPRARYLEGRELDRISELSFLRDQHPALEKAPALEAVRTSVITHRGCPGGCTFCAISLHHGRTIRSRSIESVVREVKSIASMPFFRGTISDLGGPTANLYGMGCKSARLEAVCRKPSCLWPEICRNFRIDGRPFRELLRKVRELPEVKHAFVASGLRHDVLLRTSEVLYDLVRFHAGGRLKVAPEHGSDHVLKLMRKPLRGCFEEFVRLFRQVCEKERKRCELVPYIISSFPGSTQKDMAETGNLLRRLGIKVHRAQDFWPTPSTLATALWWAEKDWTGGRLCVAKNHSERRMQQQGLRARLRGRRSVRKGREQSGGGK